MSRIHYRQLLDVLETAKEPFAPLSLSNGFSLIVTQRGGRVFGPFWNEGESLTWINPALASTESFDTFRRAGQWNLGGERLWIAPEIQYNIKDRADFWGSHHVPPQMDPGQYTLEPGARQIVLKAEMRLPAYNLSSSTANLWLDRTVQPSPVPTPAGLPLDVAFASYEQRILLDETYASAPVSQSWLLTQLNPGGQLLIPCEPGAVGVRYFGDPTSDALTPKDSAFRISLTGQRQYKMGYAAEAMTGRMGYLNTLPDGQAYFLFREYLIHPQGLYAEEVPDQPGINGHVVHVYNDGGQFGANGEMEVSGPAIGGTTGIRNSVDTFRMEVYLGPLPAIQSVAEQKLELKL